MIIKQNNLVTEFNKDTGKLDVLWIIETEVGFDQLKKTIDLKPFFKEMK